MLSYHICLASSGVQGTKAFARAVQYLSDASEMRCTTVLVVVYNKAADLDWYGQGIPTLVMSIIYTGRRKKEIIINSASTSNIVYVFYVLYMYKKKMYSPQ